MIRTGSKNNSLQSSPSAIAADADDDNNNNEEAEYLAQHFRRPNKAIYLVWSPNYFLQLQPSDIIIYIPGL